MAQPSALKPSLPQAGGLFWEGGGAPAPLDGSTQGSAGQRCCCGRGSRGGPGVQPPAWAPLESPRGQACQGGWALGAPSTRTQPRPACLRRSRVLEGSSKDLSLRRGPCHLAHKAQRG